LRHNIKVYASPGTLAALEDSGNLDARTDYGVIDGEGIECGGMHITSFSTSHDSAQPVGYSVKMPDGRRICVATDTGCVSEEVMGALKGCDLALIESNHDVGMLQNGPYPYFLKRRILSDVGHLSNDSCAVMAAQLLDTGTTRFVLGHLSAENNYPELARQTALCAFQSAGAREGVDFTLSVASRANGREMMYL